MSFDLSFQKRGKFQIKLILADKKVFYQAKISLKHLRLEKNFKLVDVPYYQTWENIPRPQSDQRRRNTL